MAGKPSVKIKPWSEEELKSSEMELRPVVIGKRSGPKGRKCVRL